MKPVVWGALTFLAMALGKMMFVATFVPESIESSLGLDMLRALVSGLDVLGVSFAFRYLRCAPAHLAILTLASG